jgi:hypothetical protein
MEINMNSIVKPVVRSGLAKHLTVLAQCQIAVLAVIFCYTFFPLSATEAISKKFMYNFPYISVSYV